MLLCRPIRKKHAAIFPYMTDGVSTAEAARLLSTTPPTVRGLLESGDLHGRKINRGSRFAWVIEEGSIHRYIAEHGKFTGERRAAKSRVAELEHEVAAIRSVIDADAPPARGSTQRERDDLRATVVTLRDALARTRNVADLQKQADDARAQVVEHLIAAVSASERADALRRDAVAEMEDAVAAVAQAGHLGDLGAGQPS
jgi:hypothetical protein